MRVLLTGGAGFLGAHIATALLDAGHEVRLLDALLPDVHPDGWPAHLDPRAEQVHADVRDRAAVDAALRGCDTVCHQAAVVGLGVDLQDLPHYVGVNELGTAVLLAAMAAADLPRLVLASSMVVYGEGAYSCPEHGPVPSRRRPAEQLRDRRWEPECPICGAELDPIPITEDQPLRPMSVYGITKRDQEELALVLGEAYGFEAVALRYLSTYGSRQQLANPYTGVAAIFAARLLAGKRPLVFEDGRQVRDLVHVSDVAAATIAAMEAPDAPGHAINVSSGERLEIADLARRLADAIGIDLEPELTGEFRAGDIRHCFADTSLAQRVLGWKPARSVDDGLRELAGWLEGQIVEDRGDEAIAELRAKGIVS